LNEVVLNRELESILELREWALNMGIVGNLWFSEVLIGHGYFGGLKLRPHEPSEFLELC
jgi:hypothetical protein